jgi:hypothetical protein
LDALGNTSRIVYDFDERVVESGRLLERNIRALLGDVQGVAERALERARAKHGEGTESVRSALSRIDSLEQAIEGAVRP